MNLIYLTILLPLLAFLGLNNYGKHLKLNQIWIIGLTMPICTITVLCLCFVDYIQLSMVTEHLSYQMTLWHWFNIGELTLNFGLHVDTLSLFFATLLGFLIFFVLPFAGYYLQTKYEVYRFFGYANLLLATLFLLIFADNFLLFLLAWQGISYCSYLMMGLKYKNSRTGIIAIRQFISMHLTDLFLLIAIGLIFKNLNTFNIQDVLSLASQNLATNSTTVYYITLFLFCSVISRIGLFPFHVVFGNTTMASIPVMTLLQTGTALIAGSYLMMRVEPLFYMSYDLLFMIGFIAMLTIILAGSIALIQKDLKRVISYFNLLQMSTFFLVFTVQDTLLSFSYIFSYTIISIFSLILTGLLIQSCGGERHIDKLGGLIKKQPIIFTGFLIILIALSAFPWISSFYYLKLILITKLMGNKLLFLCFILLISMILTLLILCRLITKLFLGTQKTPSKKIHWLHHIPLFVLGLMILSECVLIPISFYKLSELNYLGFNSYQILFVAVIIFAFFMAYFFFITKNPEVALIYKTPFVKKWVNWSHKEWYIDTFIHYILVLPIQFLINISQWHPLSTLIHRFKRKHNSFHFSIFFSRKKGIKKELMSLVLCCVTMLLLLTLL